MKLAAACVLAFLLPVLAGHAAAKPFPKDCSKAFAEAWSNRGSAATLPKPKKPCLLRGETGIYICTDGECARP